jgi:hypothetical protein
MNRGCQYIARRVVYVEVLRCGEEISVIAGNFVAIGWTRGEYKVLLCRYTDRKN